MFADLFAPETAQLDMVTAAARQRRRREVENALLSHLMSGFKPTPDAFAALQAYIDGEKSREKAFDELYRLR